MGAVLKSVMASVFSDVHYCQVLWAVIRLVFVHMVNVIVLFERPIGLFLHEVLGIEHGGPSAISKEQIHDPSAFCPTRGHEVWPIDSNGAFHNANPIRGGRGGNRTPEARTPLVYSQGPLTNRGLAHESPPRP